MVRKMLGAALVPLAFFLMAVLAGLWGETSTAAKEYTLYDKVVMEYGHDAAIAHNYVVRMEPGVPPGRYTFPIAAIPELDLYLFDLESLRYVRESYVVYVEQEVTMKLIDTIPDDTLWGDQWGPAKINGPLAWDTQTGDPSVLVAVVDTGIDYTHPDLAANYVPGGLDHVNGDDDPFDDNSHGTHVAGTINAVTDNNQGVAGMCWDCRVMAEKVLSAFGSGSSFAVAQGIIHAAHDSGADIINMSLGGGFSLVIENAVDHAWNNHDVLTVSACGNGGSSSQCLFPAALDNSMAISCSTTSDTICSFSSRGADVDVSAPGSGILSTTPGNNYGFKSGTSMSTPHAAGTAALAKSQNLAISNEQLWGLLQLTAADVGTSSENWNPNHGFGRIDAAAAVAGALSPPSGRLPKPDAEPTPTPSPTVPPGPTNTPGPTPTPSDTPLPTATDTPVATPTCPAPRTPSPRERTPTPCPGGTPPPVTATPTLPPPVTATPTAVPPTSTPTSVPPTVTPTTVPLPRCEVLVRIDGVEQWIDKPPEFCEIT